jgi:taurine transport system ATP-binding protein
MSERAEESGAAVSYKATEVMKTRDLSVRYETDLGESISVLDRMNMAVGEGEFVCLLGPSGCGKSTLLKVMAGLISPSSGVVTLDGIPITGPDWQRGVVFQSPALYLWLTVEENIAFGPRMRGVNRVKTAEDTRKFLGMIHLEFAARQKIYELSGGMRQRVAIARALINNPRILLMDEPFGALDALTRERMQSLLRGLWAQNRKTILFITHDVDEALSLGTRVLVMEKSGGAFKLETSADFTFRISCGDPVRASREFLKAREAIMSAIVNDLANYMI